MPEIKNVLEDDFEDDDEDYEESSFRQGLYNHLSPKVKQFLIDHFNESLINADAHILRGIEQTLKADILLHAVIIPEFLYTHRTITDNAEFDKALHNFKRQPGTKFN